MRVPHLKFLANTTLYACVEYLPNTRLYCYLTALVCIFFICLEFIAFAVLYREVHRNSAKLSLQTHRMQLVLLRAVAFQLLNYFVIVILPVVLSTIAFGVQFKYTEELTTLTETCLTLHGIIDYVCILYFITPYRRAVGRLVRWQKKVKSESVVVATRRLNVSQRSI
uniref:G protein-coupled receptor n=2 Tax=Bursaphelenchus xylophilus TaxID=6326 RepID=A0A1I7RV43_BURXY